MVNAGGKQVATQKLDLTSKTIEWSGKGTDGETLEPGVYGFSVESFKGVKSLGKNMLRLIQKSLRSRLQMQKQR